MNKLSSIFTGVILLAVTASVWAYDPCKPIARACMHEGYYQGGYHKHRGLVQNCMMPVVMHNKTLASASFSDKTLRSCRHKMMSEMKARKAGY